VTLIFPVPNFWCSYQNKVDKQVKDGKHKQERVNIYYSLIVFV